MTNTKKALAGALSGLSLAAALFAVRTHADAVAPPATRTFEFRYSAEISRLPEGAQEVAIWLPYPVSDANQTIRDLKVTAPFPTRIEKDAKYGNSILYMKATGDGSGPLAGPIPVSIEFNVTRTELVRRSGGPRPAADASASRWLAADKLVPNDEFVKKLARDVTKGSGTDLEKARAIYDYAVSTMTYDKTGTGWGNGDIYWACDAKRGNCTDFHALFIGLCRAVGIPARFEIGFPLPRDKHEGEIGGYHCWAEFYTKQLGWSPVDASEASKDKTRQDYFFGTICENRVQFTIGRDLVLAPKQAGDPLNFFIYPYVEVDGKPFKEGVTKKFTFKDLGA